MAKTAPQDPSRQKSPDEDRIKRLESMVESLQGQVAACAIAIEFLGKALTSFDRESSEAIAMGLEVAEMDHIDTHGETETAKAIRGLRERLGFSLSPHDE
jgi:hypothetical protein